MPFREILLGRQDLTQTSLAIVPIGHCFLTVATGARAASLITARLASTRRSQKALRSSSSLRPVNARLSVRQDLAEEELSPLALRVLEELRGRVALDDFAGVHEDDRVGDRAREAHLVGDHDHGHALHGKVNHDLEHFGDHLRIERRGGLVEQHDLGVHAKRPGNSNPLLLAAGKLARPLVRLLWNAHPLEQVHGPLVRFGIGHIAHQLGRQHEIVDDPQMREEVEALEHHADLAAHGVDVFDFAGQLVAVDDNSPAVVFLQAVDAADHGRLAGPRGAADHDPLFSVDRQIDILERLKISEEFADVLQDDDGRLSAVAQVMPRYSRSGSTAFRPDQSSAESSTSGPDR